MKKPTKKWMIFKDGDCWRTQNAYTSSRRNTLERPHWKYNWKRWQTHVEFHSSFEEALAFVRAQLTDQSSQWAV